MKERKSFPNLALVVVLTAVLAVCRVIRVCSPFWVLPRLDIPNIVLLCGVALLADHVISGKSCSVNLWTPVLAALTFGVLPYAAGFAGCVEALKLAAVGAVVFTVCTWVFESMMDRLASGPVAKAAPVLSVLMLYLAAQCFAAIL